eukprot:TRINITY_DN8838_c0_g1_i2.p2 TRINITY_DN8838_c0_g1~~TRINITY_DN8838_c0_g1_i2.p2  ORF type:complete len:156 (+),score=30.75 TRINITY_DN8838_c0_g1_i2:126-593(+)
MGKVSLELVVHGIEKAIADAQLDARFKINEAVLEAHETDSAFFEIPFNPFHPEYDDGDSDDEDVDDDAGDDDEPETAKGIWLSELKISDSPTAQQLWSIRSDLHRKVHSAMEALKSDALPADASDSSRESSIILCPATSVFASLSCRLLQLRNIV